MSDGDWEVEALRNFANHPDYRIAAKEAADTIDGLRSDLDSAVEVAFKHGATDWVRMNYPDHYTRLIKK